MLWNRNSVFRDKMNYHLDKTFCAILRRHFLYSAGYLYNHLLSIIMSKESEVLSNPVTPVTSEQPVTPIAVAPIATPSIQLDDNGRAELKLHVSDVAKATTVCKELGATLITNNGFGLKGKYINGSSYRGNVVSDEFTLKVVTAKESKKVYAFYEVQVEIEDSTLAKHTERVGVRDEAQLAKLVNGTLITCKAEERKGFLSLLFTNLMQTTTTADLKPE